MKKSKGHKTNLCRARKRCMAAVISFVSVRGVYVFSLCFSFARSLRTVILCVDTALAILAAVLCLRYFIRHQERRRQPCQVSPQPLPDEEEYGFDERVLRPVFKRVEYYFAHEKPFLDRNLTESRIAPKIFTNRTYLSRAVARFYGDNFSHYVNSWRVRYAVEQFIKNPNLKVEDLAMMSGFSSSNRFAVAFQLEMEKTPRDWMKSYREHV